MTALLLAATPLTPLLLLAALAVPRLRARAVGLVWAAPLPGLACALFAAGADPLVLDARLRLTLLLDAPAALLLGAAALLWCAAGVYARAYLRPGPGLMRFAAWWLPTMAGSLGVFVAGDLVTFYLAFALASLPAWGLVIHDRTAAAWRAGAVYLLLAVLGEAALLAAFALLAAGAPGESLAIADVLAAQATAPLRDVVIALLVLGFGLKAGLVPVHVWLPLAHPAAPMPASAVLSGAIIKAGIIGLIRFLPPEAIPTTWGGVLAALGFLTAFWGVGCGIVQRNPKTVLAYSSVSQMGVVVAALGLGAAPLAAAFYAMHHVLAKGALFLAVGAAAATGARARALVLVPAVVLALGFGGLPPTGGALAKEAVKAAFGTPAAATLAALSAAGSTLLMLHFMRRLAATLPADANRRAAPGVMAPWLALAGVAVVLPWVLLEPLGLGSLGAMVTPAALWKATWPVLLGIALLAALRRWDASLPRIPEGDVLVLARPALRRAAAPVQAGLARAEASLRGWPVAGLSLLAVALAVGLGFARALP